MNSGMHKRSSACPPRRTRLISCVEGAMAPAPLQAVLQAALADHGALLWQEQAERQQRVRAGGSGRGRGAERGGGAGAH
jgi:hypothetical protein